MRNLFALVLWVHLWQGFVRDNEGEENNQYLQYTRLWYTEDLHLHFTENGPLGTNEELICSSCYEELNYLIG